LKKHGLESFEDLNKKITAGEFKKKIDFVVSTSASFAKEYSSQKTSYAKPAKKTETFFERQFSFISNSQPEKYSALKQFYTEARERRILPERANAIAFATQLGLHPSKDASRDDIVNKIIRQLSVLPMDELKQKIEEVVKLSKTKQSLSEWADIILKRKTDE
jgi:hypothetical protein